MPIIINLEPIMTRRKISLTELSEKVGITMANMSILKNLKGKGIKYETMDKLCKILDCTPGDLFEWVDEKEFERRMGYEWEEVIRGRE
jgi:putative transcriptional regulator